MDVSTMDERVRETVRRFLQELPATSDRKIAKIVGCEPSLVNGIRRQMIASGELRQHDPPEDWRSKVIKKSGE